MTDPDRLLESQREYYDLRAPDYGDASRPDRKHSGVAEAGWGNELIGEFAPRGAVLELACGPGVYTADLAEHAESVTAVDASARMLARARAAILDPKITFVRADIFTWEPDRTYDAVFFGAWLSHVPLERFDDFWDLVRSCLAPEGRVAFIDEDERAERYEFERSAGERPVARRRLADGREFDIVKVFWRADDLEQRLRSSGWDISVRSVGESYLFGMGRRYG